MAGTISQRGQPPAGTMLKSNGGVSCVAGMGCAASIEIPSAAASPIAFHRVMFVRMEWERHLVDRFPKGSKVLKILAGRQAVVKRKNQSDSRHSPNCIRNTRVRARARDARASRRQKAMPSFSLASWFPSCDSCPWPSV